MRFLASLARGHVPTGPSAARLPKAAARSPARWLACGVALAATLAAPAWAQKPAESCVAQADARKLAGAARSSFIKKCEADAAAASDAASAADATCEGLAADKKLAGAARSSFVKKCAANPAAAEAQALCEKQASEKKLAGAARTSYVTRCVSDAGV